MAEAIKITSEEQFQTLIKENKYVVVDFWAEWCPPCKAISPIFNRMAASNTVPGKLVFAKVDLEETPGIPEDYDVASIPAFLFFQDGEVKPLDLDGRVKPGPTVQLDESEPSKLKRIVGADPRNLMLVVTELAKRAKESASETTQPEAEPVAASTAEKKDKDKETAAAPAAPTPDAKEKEAGEQNEEPNPLFAKEDEDW